MTDRWSRIFVGRNIVALSQIEALILLDVSPKSFQLVLAALSLDHPKSSEAAFTPLNSGHGLFTKPMARTPKSQRVSLLFFYTSILQNLKHGVYIHLCMYVYVCVCMYVFVCECMCESM